MDSAAVWSVQVEPTTAPAELLQAGALLLRIVGGTTQQQTAPVTVEAFDLASGHLRWTTSLTDPTLTESPQALVVGSTLWISLFSEVYAVDLRQGRLLGTVPTETAALVDDQQGGVAFVRFPSSAGELAVTDMRGDGSTRWTEVLPSSQDDASDPVFAPTTGQYVVAGRDCVWIGSAADGSVRCLPISLGHATFPTAVASGDRALVASEGVGAVIALPQGTVIARFSLDDDSHALVREADGDVWVSLSRSPGIPYTVDEAGRSIRDGHVLWRLTSTPFSYGYGIGVTRVGHVLIGTTAPGDGPAVALDLRSGRTVWQRSCPFSSQSGVGDGPVWVTECGSDLVGVDAETGARQWAVPGTAPTWLLTSAGLVRSYDGRLDLRPVP